MTENQDPQTRAAVYIDGFNLYHSIREMEEPFLKWCDLWRLSEMMCAPKDLDLQKVVFCTAVPRREHSPGQRDRHNRFNSALISKGVEVLKGHHVYDPDAGKHSEKQSDINVALSVILDGIDDVYDWAFLVSADSDQAATARFFHERLPDKKLIAVAPPDRNPPDKSLSYVETSFTLTKEQIEACVMPAYVPGKTGGLIRRPDEYTPPSWWVHPDDRPRRKKNSN